MTNIACEKIVGLLGDLHLYKIYEALRITFVCPKMFVVLSRSGFCMQLIDTFFFSYLAFCYVSFAVCVSCWRCWSIVICSLLSFTGLWAISFSCFIALLHFSLPLLYYSWNLFYFYFLLCLLPSIWVNCFCANLSPSHRN